jgi:hypothetical protein
MGKSSIWAGVVHCLSVQAVHILRACASAGTRKSSPAGYRSSAPLWHESKKYAPDVCHVAGTNRSFPQEEHSKIL